MTQKLYFPVAALLGGLSIMLAGCDKPEPMSEPDQCMRREIFKECLQTVPAGPQKTVTNDWSEVIDECASAAFYQSRRKPDQIKPECK